MDITKCRIGQEVRCPVLDGKIIKIEEGYITARAVCGLSYRDHAAINFSALVRGAISDRMKKAE